MPAGWGHARIVLVDALHPQELRWIRFGAAAYRVPRRPAHCTDILMKQRVNAYDTTARHNASPYEGLAHDWCL